MKRSLICIFAALAGAAGADLPPLHVSQPRTYAVDTAIASPCAIKSAADLASLTNGPMKAAWRAGDTVMLSRRGGPSMAIVSNAAARGAAHLPPIVVGGTWTLTSSTQGDFLFAVRDSLFRPVSGGTETAPARIADADELLDAADGGENLDGCVFVIDDPGLTTGNLAIPSGYCIEPLAPAAAVADAGTTGLWRIAASADGCLSKWAAAHFAADTLKSGPDRKLRIRTARGIAYPAESWTAAIGAAASIAVTSPDGVTAEYPSLSSSGFVPFLPTLDGVWTIVLEAAGETMTSHVTVVQPGLRIIMR